MWFRCEPWFQLGGLWVRWSRSVYGPRLDCIDGRVVAEVIKNTAYTTLDSPRKVGEFWDMEAAKQAIEERLK